MVCVYPHTEHINHIVSWVRRLSLQFTIINPISSISKSLIYVLNTQNDNDCEIYAYRAPAPIHPSLPTPHHHQHLASGQIKLHCLSLCLSQLSSIHSNMYNIHINKYTNCIYIYIWYRGIFRILCRLASYASIFR